MILPMDEYLRLKNRDEKKAKEESKPDSLKEIKEEYKKKFWKEVPINMSKNEARIISKLKEDDTRWSNIIH